MKYIILVLGALLLLSACEGDAGVGSEAPALVNDWRDYDLKDIDGNSIIVADFDKPAFIETFATWCANCNRQQEQMSKLHEELGDSVITVAINIDPNEGKDKIEAHVSKHGFTSQYVVPPREFTQSLVDEFGPGIASAPTVPLLFVCNGKTELLERGVKSLERLKEVVEAC